MGGLRLITWGSVISCWGTCSAVGAGRIWQRWAWAVYNYVGLMVRLRNSQWWCLMIMLTLGSFAKGIYILHNRSFMMKIPVQHFWATRADRQGQTSSHRLKGSWEMTLCIRVHTRPTASCVSGAHGWMGLIGKLSAVLIRISSHTAFMFCVAPRAGAVSMCVSLHTHTNIDI